ncbi:hypothetical protein NDU88_000824 [Pleurodeles waltl]|uniref:Uncharacterized protein n=1 Tax=Pleurodeles waltl TaxID=8319 RepID=A0AAV7MSZ1_PLEWA|nr:hypothetical protein NDU88_000824 [Pleurodeles waltl]
METRPKASARELLERVQRPEQLKLVVATVTKRDVGESAQPDREGARLQDTSDGMSNRRRLTMYACR